MEPKNKVNITDNKKIEWDFRELQDVLEGHYDNPERLLLEAYRSLIFFVEEVSTDVDIQEIKNHSINLNLILHGVYDAINRHTNAEILESLESL